MGRGRVVVVTGGATGIGAAIAEELGRTGSFVVTLDPNVSVDGSARLAPSGPTTAERIVAAGGQARSSNVSVTDFDAVQALFAQLVDELGALDAVINVAGISRPTGFGSGLERDWADVLDVHLNGYLNVLRSALPIMAAAGHGRILGVTSGSGWRPANAGAYSAAKRSVAALTWQIGRVAPAGVTVNALSPIALTRMVTGATARPPATAAQSSASTGGLSLSAMPPPESLGPIGAYLASEEFSWCSGRIVFSNGSEVALVEAPHLLEAARTSEVASLAHALDAIVAKGFMTAEGAQASNGGSNARFPGVFDESEIASGERACTIRSCAIFTDDPDWGSALNAALTARGVACAVTPTEGVDDFAGAAARLGQSVEELGSLNAVVIARLADARPAPEGATWQNVLESHAEAADGICSDVAWINAAAAISSSSQEPLRVATLLDTSSPAGHTRGQANAQLSRASHLATEGRVHAYSIGVEAGDQHAPVAELVAHLLCDETTTALSGAELVAGPGWIGLNSHPRPRGTIVYGGPAVPDWLDDALRRLANGRDRHGH